MELEVPPCSDSELAILLDKWSRRAIQREPLALAMARAFARERTRRETLRTSPPSSSPARGEHRPGDADQRW